LQWSDVNNEDINSTNREYVNLNQRIRYYVGVLAGSKPTSVTINNVQATELTDYNVVSQPSGSATSKTVWYIDWSAANSGEYDMTTRVVVNGAAYEKIVGKVRVN
jgi:hypothetical protein